MRHRSKTSSKRRAKKNALVHGIYSRDVVLPWERRTEFDRLLCELREEWSPEGRMEEETVLDLAMQVWRKRRVSKLYAAQAHADPFAEEIAKTGLQSFSGIRKSLRSDARFDRQVIM